MTSAPVVVVVVVVALFLRHIATDSSGERLAERSPESFGDGGAGAGCVRNISDIQSKCLLAPVVFEGWVQVTGHRSDERWTNARLRVIVVHKGEVEDNSLVNVGFIGGGGGGGGARDEDEDDDDDDGGCSFPRDMFEAGKKYVVFAARSSPQSPHTLTVFSEPVLRTRRSSRIVRKTLCQGCAKAPSVSGLKDISVRPNSKVQLKCKAKGNPIPVITWLKDDHPVTETENVVVNKTKSASRLIIKKVEKDHAGQYECRATSSYGPPASSKGNLKIRTNSKRGRTTKKPSTTTLGPDQSQPCGGYDEYCLNGGTCFFYETLGEYVCQCAEGYKGRRCESKDVYHLGSMDWTYHINVLTVVVILAGFLFCLTIGGIVTYVIHRKKNEQCEEAEDGQHFDSGNSEGRPFARRRFVESICLRKLNLCDETMSPNRSSEVSSQFNGQAATISDNVQQLDNHEIPLQGIISGSEGLVDESTILNSQLNEEGQAGHNHNHYAVQDLNANYHTNNSPKPKKKTPKRIDITWS